MRDSQFTEEPVTGWICPVCGRGVAPDVGVCPCQDVEPAPAYYPPLPPWYYPYYPPWQPGPYYYPPGPYTITWGETTWAAT